MCVCFRFCIEFLLLIDRVAQRNVLMKVDERTRTEADGVGGRGQEEAGEKDEKKRTQCDAQNRADDEERERQMDQETERGVGVN